MKHRLLILFLCCFLFSLKPFGQDTIPVSILIPEATRGGIDSLKKSLQLTTNIREKIDCLNKLAHLYSGYHYDSSLIYASNARSLSEKENYARGIAIALLRTGNAIETFHKDWIAALIYYKQSVSISEKNGVYNDIHEGYSILLNCFFYLGDFLNAMTITTKGLASASKRNDKEKILQYNLLIGEIYLRQKNYAEALKSYTISMEMVKLMNDEEQSGLVYLGLADVYMATGDSSKAFQNLSLAKSNFEKNFYKVPRTLAHKLPFTLYKSGLAFNLFGNKDSALLYVLEAIRYTHLVSCDKFDIANYYLLLGDLYRQQSDYKKAKESLYKGMAIAKEINHKEDTRDACNYLSIVFAAEKKYDSAWHYGQLYIDLKDSIVNEKTRYGTEVIKAIYDIREKDREIVRQSNLRNILIAGFVFLLISIGFLYNRYQLRQKNRYQQELNKQQNDLFNAIAAAQEQERKRIAQDIHDSLGSVLSAAKLKMAEVKEMKPELGANEKFLSSVSLIDEASSELRNISHNIMPATLSKLGLAPALKNLCEKITSHKGLQVTFYAHEMKQRHSEQLEISIYRIVLELINNVVKHAQATKTTIQLIRYPYYINVTVEDNGKGFLYEKLSEEGSGIGLGNVVARVEYLKGKINIDSVPDKGTTVIIDIPVS